MELVVGVLLQDCCLWTNLTPPIHLKRCCWPRGAYSRAMSITLTSYVDHQFLFGFHILLLLRLPRQHVHRSPSACSLLAITHAHGLPVRQTGQQTGGLARFTASPLLLHTKITGMGHHNMRPEAFA